MLHVILQIFETKATTYSSRHLIFFRVDMPSSHIYFSKWYFQNALTVLNGFSFGFILKTHQPELNGILKTDLWRPRESQFLFWDTVLSVNSQLDYIGFWDIFATKLHWSVTKSTVHVPKVFSVYATCRATSSTLAIIADFLTRCKTRELLVY